MTTDWNADLYLRYADERTRPAAELLQRVPLEAPGRVVDLGCGPGNSTALLAARFPNAELLGIDSSPAMVEAGRVALPRARFEIGDIAEVSLPAADLLFSNAALQWVPGHETLIPRLWAQVAPGGVLAVQMPDNQDEPSHRAMRETAADGPWAVTLADADRIRSRILAAEGYYDLLAEEAEVDVWRTTYHHPMADPDAIVTWVSATGLRPFLAPLSEAERPAFIAAYRARLDAAYPARADGRRILAFPRLFIVAKKRG